MILELYPQYDVRTSFYGKAQVEVRHLNATKSVQYNLLSYNTLVATVNEYKTKKVFRYLGKHSQTTTRHQKEFFKQHGLNDKEIKELFKIGLLVKQN